MTTMTIRFPGEPVGEAGSKKYASRSQIRALLARVPNQERQSIERIQIGDCGIERMSVGNVDLKL